MIRPGYPPIVTEPDRQSLPLKAGRVGKSQQRLGRMISGCHGHQTPLAYRLAQPFVQRHRRPAFPAVVTDGDRPPILTVISSGGAQCLH